MSENISYLDFIASNLNLDNFSMKTNYGIGHQVIYNKSIYESLKDHNIGSCPINSDNWKLLL